MSELIPTGDFDPDQCIVFIVSDAPGIRLHEYDGLTALTAPSEQAVEELRSRSWTEVVAEYGDPEDDAE